MQGMTVKIPGPFDPPFLNRPRRNMTARSYSVTTFNENKQFVWLEILCRNGTLHEKCIYTHFDTTLICLHVICSMGWFVYICQPFFYVFFITQCMYAKVILKKEKDYKYLSFTHFVLHYLFNYNPRYVWHQHKWFYCSLSLRHINTYEERIKFKCIYVGFCYQTMTEHKKVLKRWAVYDIISKKHDRENYRLKTVRKKLCLYEILQIQRVFSMNIRHWMSQGIWIVSNATQTIFHALLTFEPFEKWLLMDSMNGLMD